eukprot:189512-Lingulodinium_polyedra.AAC.1
MAQHGVEEVAIQRATAKMSAGAIRTAAQILQAGASAPPSRGTFEELQRLIGQEGPDGEATALTEECQLARRAQVPGAAGPTASTMKR